MNVFNRDLSWLSFNYRVLMEAMDESVPLIERLRFAAIFSSNLDEFFRVRVADIRNIIQIDKKKINEQIDYKPQEILEEILSEVSHQQSKFGDVLEKIIDQLAEKGLFICRDEKEIPEEIQPELLHYFKTKVAAYLKPFVIADKEEVFLDNLAIYLAVKFEDENISIVKIPTDNLPRFYKSMVGDKTYYIFLDDILRLHLDIIFKNKTVIECYSIKLNKDADLQIDDEYDGDIAEKIENQIANRNLGVPSRFLFDMNMSNEFLATLVEKLKLSSEDVVTGGRYHNLFDFWGVGPSNSDMVFEKLDNIKVDRLEYSRSIFKEIDKDEIFLHFPYHSYDYVLQFFSEAAIDPEVEEIYVTFYRMAKNSLIAEALISAAINGKKVSVFMELKARFDEANNIQWAKRMKEVGITIHYSLPGLKVHAKVALIVKKDKKYGFFGTGNLNEKTSEIYSDFGLLSDNQEMCNELQSVFNFLLTNEKPERFNHLIVSQFNAHERFLGMIDREIQNVKEGKKGLIIIKVNNLQEKILIKKVYEAAEAGVEVRMLIRSICCLVPNDNIRVKRIVGRFLEHARAFYFYNDGKDEMYLGSSDWMNRSIYRRVEVSFPVYDEKLKGLLKQILDLHWEDDIKGVWLNPIIENIRPKRINNVQAQMDSYELLKNQYG